MASMSNTKKEILDELDTVKSLVEAKDAELQKLAETNGSAKRQTLRAVKETELREKADNTDPTDLSSFRISISDQLQDLEKVISEKLEAKKAVEELLELKKEELQTHHDILVGANALEAVLVSTCEAEAKYNKNLKAMEDSFKLKETELQADHTKNTKDLDKRYERMRDDFDYTFQRDVERRNDAAEQSAIQKQREVDDYRLKIHEDLEKRASDLTYKEEEFAELKVTVDEYPENLEQEVIEAVKKAKESAGRSSHFETSALKTKHDAEVSVLTAKIESLTQRNTEYITDISDLTKKLSQAYERNTDLASSAIEASGSQKIVVNTETRTK